MLLLPLLLWPQTPAPPQTPNIGLYLPAHGSFNWDTWYNLNWQILDGFTANKNYTAAWTGAVQQTVTNVFSNTVFVKDFGAKCDGSTIDTTAIQAAIDFADTLAGGKMIQFPNGTCLVNTTLLVKNTSGGFGMRGTGSATTTLQSTATNIPILQFKMPLLHDFYLTDMRIGFSTPQSSSNTLAHAIRVGDDTPGDNPMVFNSHFENLTFYNAYHGIDVTGNGTIWGDTFRSIVAEGSMSGSTILHNPSTTGAVRNHFEMFYNSQSIAEPQFKVNLCIDCTFTNIESNNGLNNIISLGGDTGTVNDMHVEALTLTSANAIAIDLINSQLSINGISANANVQANPGVGNNVYFIGTSNAQGFFSLDRIGLSGVTVTSGNIYILHTPFQPPSGKNLWYAKNIQSTIPLTSPTDPIVSYGLLAQNETQLFATPQGIATAGANANSSPFSVQASFWNGTTAALDQWQWQNIEGSGTNPTSTLTLTHTGTSGTASLALPNIVTAPDFIPAYRSISSSPIFAGTNDHTIFCTGSGTQPMLNLPNPGGANAGHSFTAIKVDAGATACGVIAKDVGTGTQYPINGSLAQVSLSAQYKYATFVSDGTQYFIVGQN